MEIQGRNSLSFFVTETVQQRQLRRGWPQFRLLSQKRLVCRPSRQREPRDGDPEMSTPDSAWYHLIEAEPVAVLPAVFGTDARIPGRVYRRGDRGH